MFRKAFNVVAPRWRHFIPKADSLNVKVPKYESSRDPSGAISLLEKLRFSFVAGEIVEGDYTFFALPEGTNVSDPNAINVSFNDVIQDNINTVLYYVQEDDIAVPQYGPKTFFYDAINRRIVFQRADGGSYNKAPEPGTNVMIEVVNEKNANSLYIRIPMKREWLIQGANPIDPTLVNPNGTGSDQFQGGYRCTLRLISQCAHGHVKISDDKFAFEYRPDMGYSGSDSFAYRLVNALGQESSAYCVRLEVGI